MKNEEAKLFSLKWKDAIKGFIVAVITTVITVVFQAIQINEFPQTLNDWKVILIAGIGSGLAYIIKNFLTSSDDKFLTKEGNTELPIENK